MSYVKIVVTSLGTTNFKYIQHVMNWAVVATCGGAGPADL
jgi:hypothetical protein